MATATTKTKRPWHRGLTREAVAGRALRILDEEGREALTMRRLATSLGVEAASLYAHVRSKDELVDAVLDAVLATVEVPEPVPDVRASIVAGFASYRSALLRHPTIVILMTERARPSSAQFRLARRSIELFESAGLSTRVAVDAHVHDGCVRPGVHPPGSQPARAGSPADAAPPDPVMARVLATLADRTVEERFEVGLG